LPAANLLIGGDVYYGPMDTQSAAPSGVGATLNAGIRNGTGTSAQVGFILMVAIAVIIAVQLAGFRSTITVGGSVG
jgi:hypothetical protein